MLTSWKVIDPHNFRAFHFYKPHTIENDDLEDLLKKWIPKGHCEYRFFDPTTLLMAVWCLKETQKCVLGSR